MDVPAEILSAFPPSEDALFDFARCQVDAAMLEQIANADYGFGFHEALPLLQKIGGRGLFPAVFPYELTEVLELTVFSDPDRPNPTALQPGRFGKTGHHARLFACAVLMSALSDPAIECHGGVPDSTLASCLISARALGTDAMQATARFLAWQAVTARSPEPVLSALGILILALSKPHPNAGRFLEAIADWVIALDTAAHDQFGSTFGREPPPLPFSVGRGDWRPLETALQQTTQSVYPAVVKEKLQLCSLLLSTGY